MRLVRLTKCTEIQVFVSCNSTNPSLPPSMLMVSEGGKVGSRSQCFANNGQQVINSKAGIAVNNNGQNFFLSILLMIKFKSTELFGHTLSHPYTQKHLLKIHCFSCSPHNEHQQKKRTIQSLICSILLNIGG